MSFFHFLSQSLDLYTKSSFGHIPWWVANWAMKLKQCSPGVFSIVSAKFHIDWNGDFQTNLVWNSWCFGVFADISARSSRKKTQSIIYIYIYYILHVQCCVRVSASNFQVLTRKSGGARALGNIARFLAGPARSRTTNAESYQEFSLHWIISRSFLTLHHIKKFAYTASHQEISLHCITSRNFLTLHHIKKFPSCFVFTWNLLLAFPGHRSQSLAAEGELRDLCRITYCSVDYHPLRPPAINKQHTAAGNCENLGWTLRSFRWQGLFMSDALCNLHI